MADRKLTYQVGVTADTSQLQTQVNQAVQSLNNLGLKSGISAELREASQAALELGANLSSAFNQETGKLDLINFNNNLKQSGSTLSQYYDKLIALGPAGQTAFTQVAKAITSAELPLKRSNQLLDSLWITMKNTMRWQLTSSMLQGFTSAIQSAYSYTQDLNESLNSIRIVTQKSTDDMASFAKQANEAAKALSTTTVDYTDASLIYYQQGLDDEAVQERTEATIKFANVSAQSAETASEELTAVWNNFDDGSKSLEYYVDVMTALGASTASSSQEIAEGLEKFAAISDSVGLSYEYATAALATVTATTRQSADVVGTAFKTLFARIQDLSLGETLDDGVTLDTYSKALYQVGINILDANNQLKDMDDILEELGDKWGQISSAQQVALAQTVAGTRQYTQLMALMNNWDFFQENLSTAYSSEGTLNEQAEIYAESWEAARDRVAAAAEDIYDSLINDEFFIGLDNAVTPILSGIANIIDGMGGLKGVSASVFTLMSMIFGDKIETGIRKWIENIGLMTGIEQERVRALQEEANLLQADVALNSDGNEVIALRRDLTNEEVQYNIELAKIKDSLSEKERAYVSQIENGVTALKQQFELATKVAEETRKKSTDSTTSMFERAMTNSNLSPQGIMQAFGGKQSSSIDTSTMWLGTKNYYKESEQFVTAYTKSLNNLISKYKESIEYQTKLRQITDRFNSSTEKNQETLMQLCEEFELTDEQTQALAASLNKVGASNLGALAQQMRNAGTETEGFRIILQALTESTDNEMSQLESSVSQATQAFYEAKAAGEAFKSGMENVTTFAQKVSLTCDDLASKIVKAGQTFGQLSMAISSLSSLSDVFTDDDLSDIEKLTQILISLSMTLPILKTGYDILNKAIEAHKVKLLEETAATTQVTVAKEAYAKAAAGAKAAALGWTAVIAVIAVGAIAAAAAIKKQHEATLEAAQASIDAANAAKEESDTNKELIASTKDALSSYVETGENKEDLDELTRSLAEAYNIEGSALARLTGKYDDYNDVIKQAIIKQKEELKTLLEEEETAINASETKVLETARKKVGHLTDSTYSGSFGGWATKSGTTSEEDIAAQYLTDNVDALQTTWYDYVAGRRSLSFSLDADDTQNIIDFYDQLDTAITQMEANMSTSDLGASGLYASAKEWRDKMTDTVEEYKELVDTANQIKIQLGQFNGQTITDDEVNSLQDYEKWVTQVTNTLTSLKYTEDEVSDAIDSLVSTSVNPSIEEFKDLYDAIVEIKNICKDPNLDIDKIFNDDAYDNDILASLNWATVTVDNFDEVYSHAQAYQDAIDGISNATSRLEAAQQALSDLNDGEFDKDSLTSLAEFDWGNAEEGIISFEEFLSKTTSEQQQYLQTLINQSYQQIISSSLDTITLAEQGIEEANERIQAIGADTLEQAQDTVEAWGEVEAVWSEYQEAKKNGGTKDFTFPEIDIEGFNWDDFKDKTADEMQEAIEEGTEGAKAIISAVNVEESAIKDFEQQIEDTKIEITINAKLNFENQLTQIENSVDGIVSIFDAISSGMDKVTNDAGESVWSLSLEAAQAIESIYPGFMRQANLLRDGTFELTDDLYEAFFNSSNGILAVDADTKANILQNDITELEAKRKSAEEAMSIAQRLANGELKLSSLSEGEKEKLLAEFKQAQSINNGDMLDNEVDALTTSDTNWSNLWTDVGSYSSQGAENMANNVAKGTESVLQNLQAIRDAAYYAGLQVSKIGTGDTSKEDINTKVYQWTGVGDTTIDTSSEDAFIDSMAANIVITAEQMDETIGTIDQKIANAQSIAVGEALVAIYQDEINSIDAAIAADKTAISKLLSAIDDTYDSLSGKSSSGSSSTSAYDKEDLKTLSDVEDRYHEINRQIERQNDLLEDLEDNIDRAFGSAKLDKYDEKIAAATTQLENYNSKLSKAQDYLKDDAALVQSYFSDAVMDSNGEITNYEDLLKENMEIYNAAIEVYNQAVSAGELTSEQHDVLKSALDDAEAAFEKRQKALEKYESTLDTVRDTTDEIQELTREIADTRLDKIEYKLEVVITIKDMKKAVKELTKEIAESFGDALTHGVEAAKIGKEIADLDMSKLSDYQENYNSLVEELANATEEVNIERIQSDLENLQSDVISTAEDLLDWIESVETMYTDALDAASERYSIFTNQLEHNTTVLDTIKELYALQGVTYKTAQGYAQLQKVSQEKLEAQVASAQLQKAWYENAREALLQAEAALEGVAETDGAYDTLKNNRDALLEEYNEAQEAMLSAAQSAMETAQEMYTTAVEKAAYDFSQAISNGLGLDLLQDKYDHYIETEERYLDKVNEAYQVSVWYSKLQADIDDTSNVKYKDRLKELQEEINIRRENNTLSEYDLEILEAKYKVLQAQMELEDAQNNKSQLRLVRDSQGNWNYQYTSDASSIADAEQNLLDAENEWYNIAKQQVSDVTGEIISAWSECEEAVQEIYNDMTLTDQERADRAAEIYEYYTEKIKYLENEKQVAVDDMTEAGNKNLIDNAIITGDTITDLTGVTADDIKNIVAESGASITDLLLADSETIKDIVGDNTDLIDLFDNTFAADLDNMTTNAGNFESYLQDLLSSMESAWNTYETTISKVAEDTGTDLDTLAGYVDTVSEATDRARDAGLDAAEAMWTELDAVQDLSEGYAALIDEVYEYINALSQLAGSIATTYETSSGLGDSSTTYDKNTDYNAAIQYGIANGLMSYGDSTYDELFNQREAKIEGENLQSDYYGLRGTEADDFFNTVQEGDTLTGWAAGQFEDEDAWKQKMHDLGIAGYATGGYTGDFDDAKLAFLHEKELVLNQEDTKNILAAVSTIRSLGSDVFSQIEKALDSNASASLAMMAQNLATTSAPIMESGTLEQLVRIEHVEFPNVTSSDEIQDALASIVNDASQWAKRRTS